MQSQITGLAAKLEDKIRGTLWGAVLGDVIGAHLQFARNIDQKKINQAFNINGGGVHKLEPGQPTDDSQLGYSLGRGLIRGKGELNLNMIAQQMGNWFLSKPIDVGGTIRKSIPKACNMTSHQAHLCRKAAKECSQQSQSNGSLMSITPLSIWCHRLSSSQIIKAVEQYTILIHPNKLVVLANTFYTLMIIFLLRSHTDNDNVRIDSLKYAKTEINQKVPSSKQKQQFFVWIKQVQQNLNSQNALKQKVSPIKSSGWVRVAFTYAIFYLINGKSFKDSLFGILALKGDTDTNACIAGGLMGAYYGFSKLQLRQQIDKIKQWRPKKVKRPQWLVPGIVIQKFVKNLIQISPSELKIVGGEPQQK